MSDKTEKKYKTFTDYYKDPVFKKKHNDRMAEIIDCPCGAATARNNMPRHQKTKKHLKAMYEKVLVNPKFDLDKVL